MSMLTSERFEVHVSGPLCLSSDEPDSLTWLARTGSYVVGWAKLCRPQQHVAVLQELHLSESFGNPRAAARRLCAALYDYAREHGLLKLRIQCDGIHDSLYEALAHAGFSHDQEAGSGRVTQVYVDLYRNPRGRLTEAEVIPSLQGGIRLAS